MDRLARDCRLAGNLAYPSSTPSLGLGRYVQSPLSLIEHSVHHLVLIVLSVIYHALSLSHLSLSVYFIFVSVLRMTCVARFGMPLLPGFFLLVYHGFICPSMY